MSIHPSDKRVSGLDQEYGSAKVELWQEHSGAFKESTAPNRSVILRAAKDLLSSAAALPFDSTAAGKPNVSEPHITAVSSSPDHGFSKQPQPAIHLLTSLGVEGDAHCGETVQHLYLMRKDATAPNRMQVHLLPAELLDEVNAEGFHVRPGGLGENILTRNLDLRRLPAGSLLYIGEEAVIELTCLRQPCAQIDRYQPGLQRRMFSQGDGKRRPRVGVMGIVLQGGTIRAGDRIRVELPPAPHRALTT